MELLSGIGAIVFSALYISAIFIAASLKHSVPAQFAAIISMGVTYVAFSAQVTFPRNHTLAAGLVLLSIIIGLVAGAGLFLVP